MSDFPSSKFQRGKLFAKSGLKLGANYARHHLENKLGKKKNAEQTSEFHKRNAETMFKDFAQLRGTALKMAQAISIDRSVLPDEFSDVLARAQYQVPPISKSLVRQIIKQELGSYPEDLFAEFEPEAFAAASLGQVHRARLKNGTKTAIKVQYPNVRDTISSDLAMGKVVFRQIAGAKAVDKYYDEIHSKLMEETDYIKEGEHIEQYRKRYDHPDFITPKWLPDYSTQRVLTMTYVEGLHLNEFLKTNPSQTDKNRYGQLLWDFFHLQVNDHHTVHADTHPGNYSYTADGKLGILDFGCIKQCPPDFFNSFLGLLPAHYHSDEDRLLKLYFELELLYDDPAKNKNEKAFYQFCRNFGELMVTPYRNQRFDFNDPAFDQKMTVLLKQAVADGEPRGSQHFVYIARVVIGLYRMLMQLGSEIRTDHSFETITTYLKHQNDKSLKPVI